MRSAGKERNEFRSTTPHGSDQPAANSRRSQGSELSEVTEKKWRCRCFTNLFQVRTTRLMGSSWCITGQSRYPIEVGIVTGKVREPVRLHNRHDHRVVRQEPCGLADSRGGIHKRCGDCKDLDAHLWNSLQRGPVLDASLHGGGILLQPVNDLGGPAKPCRGFKS